MIGGLLAVLGVIGAAAVRIARALPLVDEGAVNDGGSTKKDDKKDMMKKGRGRRTQRKKSKKGK
ncbi:MAG: hypothetical protein ACRDWD_16155 [Acidimicrobiia bacterium]